METRVVGEQGGRGGGDDSPFQYSRGMSFQKSRFFKVFFMNAYQIF